MKNSYDLVHGLVGGLLLLTELSDQVDGAQAQAEFVQSGGWQAHFGSGGVDRSLGSMRVQERVHENVPTQHVNFVDEKGK
jgi:hypothetical protein